MTGDPTDVAAKADEDVQHARAADGAPPVFTCDRCGGDMIARQCKIVCPRCGHRFDCSDLNLYFD
jgi:Zn finger protein HypA/HybF involved in hydrogenase expression